MSLQQVEAFNWWQGLERIITFYFLRNRKIIFHLLILYNWTGTVL